MPKRKEFSRSKDKGSRQVKLEESADDVLESGVKFEEAAEKWRGGDKVKSARFFCKALHVYEAGLERFPTSKDLLYNRARLQFDLSQQDQLLEHLPNELSEDLLQTALLNHMIALKHDPEHADLLFNTSQILISVAEETRSDNNDFEALRLYREALLYFEKCLKKQEEQFEDFQLLSQASVSSASATSNNFPIATGLEMKEVWTRVEEGVSRETLYDSVTEIENTLSAICTLRCPLDEEILSWVKNFHEQVVHERLNTYARQSHGEAEAAVKVAWFRFAFCDCAFRNGYIDLPGFEKEYSAAFQDIPRDIESKLPLPGIMVNIEAQIQLSQSLRRKILMSISSGGPEANDIYELQKSAWVQLSQALDSLSQVCKLQVAQEASSVPTALYQHRGDCELARRWLGQTVQPYSVAKSSEARLSRNAQVYYKGAKDFAKRAGDEQNKELATIKQAVASCLAGEDNQNLRQEIDTCDASTWQEAVEEMTKSLLLTDVDITSLEDNFK